MSVRRKIGRISNCLFCLAEAASEELARNAKINMNRVELKRLWNRSKTEPELSSLAACDAVRVSRRAVEGLRAACGPRSRGFHFEKSRSRGAAGVAINSEKPWVGVLVIAALIRVQPEFPCEQFLFPASFHFRKNVGAGGR